MNWITWVEIAIWIIVGVWLLVLITVMHREERRRLQRMREKAEEMEAAAEVYRRYVELLSLPVRQKEKARVND